jgi:hypothetical protein
MTATGGRELQMREDVIACKFRLCDAKNAWEEHRVPARLVRSFHSQITTRSDILYLVQTSPFSYHPHRNSWNVSAEY